MRSKSLGDSVSKTCGKGRGNLNMANRTGKTGGGTGWTGATTCVSGYVCTYSK